MDSRKRRGRQKDTLGKVASNARRNAKSDASIVRDTSMRVNTSVTPKKNSPSGRRNPVSVTPKHIKLPSGQTVYAPDLRGSVAERSLGALKDMRRFDLSFSESAKLWHLRPSTFRKYARSGLRNLKNGRIAALTQDRIHFIFQKPTTKPGIFQSVTARSLKERRLFVDWNIAVSEAAKGKYALLDSFPKNSFIDGTRLPTGHVEVQKILDALAASGAKFEGPYRVWAVQS